VTKQLDVDALVQKYLPYSAEHEAAFFELGDGFYGIGFEGLEKEDEKKNTGKRDFGFRKSDFDSEEIKLY
jgi:hypothetical protein